MREEAKRTAQEGFNVSKNIEQAAVLGSGVMGAAIAAHLANAGVKTLLLDIVPTELTAEEAAKGLTLTSSAVRNRIARSGLEHAKKAKPAAFFHPSFAERITTGNFEDDLAKLRNCDWIIEAVVERLDIKRALFAKVAAHRKTDAVVSTNTSGIPISSIAEGLPDDFRRHFLGTHFFNPPRYMKLLEMIPLAQTLPDVVSTISNFCDRRLGKGIVIAKDTPNFIANRIGTFGAMHAMRVMQEDGYTVEEIDRITGPVIGRPKTASFRTLDLVGLDTFLHVARNIYEQAAGDEMREVYRLPEFIEKMAANGWLGNKSGGGFYKKVKGSAGDERLTLDLSALEYRPAQKVKFPSLEMVKPIEDLGQRLRALVYGKDRVANFLWKTISASLVYTASRIPEIAGDIVSIDRAMRWGFAWQMGPFEMWDAIGVPESVEKLQKEERAIPSLVGRMLAAGATSFYKKAEGWTYVFDFGRGEYVPVESPPGIIVLSDLKERRGTVKRNAGASLVDLGDGIGCLEFHSKMNSIGADTVQMMNFAIKEGGQYFDALVVGNQGDNFSVGANLMLLLLEAQDQNWEEIDLVIRAFQNANMALKYSSRPVVVAPFNMSLGGGCEITLHGGAVRASAELYMGLVETGVGLIPAGGGTKEFLLRSIDAVTPGADLLPAVRQCFETIALAKVSMSAVEAQRMGFMRGSDSYSMNRDRLIEDAKQAALALVRSDYQPKLPRADIRVLGASARAMLDLGIHLMKRAGYITDHDAVVGEKLAWILTGGNLHHEAVVSEQYLLDLEREAFLSLCGYRKTLERIQHTLKTGKPLRN